MRSHRAQAVVLRVLDHGEGHRIVELLTRERGLVRAFAPAAQRSRRRFGGALEPATLLEASWHERPGRDLAGLDEAAVTEGHVHVREDLDRIALAACLLDLSRSLVRDAQPHPQLFELLVNALARLDRGAWPAWGLVAFELGALAAFGAAPRLDACAGCGRPPGGERSRFSPGRSGLLCPACGPRWEAGDLALSRPVRLALEALAGAGAGPEVLDRAEQLPDDAEAVGEGREALERVITGLLGQRPKSLDFLDALKP